MPEADLGRKVIACPKRTLGGYRINVRKAVPCLIEKQTKYSGNKLNGFAKILKTIIKEPIEDSNPERRNLVVLSMAIIAFYVGGCEIPASGEIELPLIKLKFTDAYHLAWLVWITLAWFLFRYWITERHKIVEVINQEMHLKQYGLHIFATQIRQAFGYNPGTNLSTVRFRRVDSQEGQPSTLHLYDFDEELGEDGAQNDIWPDVRSSLWLRVILFVAMLRLFFSYPALSGYYAPYLLASIAIGFATIGLWK